MKIIQTILILATVALLVEAYPQNSTFSFTTLTQGVFDGSLPNASDIGAAFHVQAYRLWIPEGTKNYQITFKDNADCNQYLTFSIRSDGFPCSEFDYYDDDDEDQPCIRSIKYSGIYAKRNLQPVTMSFYGDGGDGFEYRVNTYLYISVGRTGSNPNTSGWNQTCSFSINSTISECPQGEVAVNQGGGGISCVSYSNATSGSIYTIQATNISSPVTVFKFNVPENTGYITVNFNSSSSTAIVRGNSYLVPTTTTGSQCTIGNSVKRDFTQSQGDCYVPRSGDFYFAVEDNTLYNATVSFIVVTCPAGLGGYNCTANATSIASASQLSIGGQYSVNVSVEAAYGRDGGLFSYYYVDFPSIPVAGEFSIQVDSTSQSNQFYYKKFGFPELAYNNNNLYPIYSTPTSYIIFNQFDWVAGGRFYFGLFCYYQPPPTVLRQVSGCTFTVNVNVNIQQQISTGVVSTGISTGSAATTGSGSITTGGSQLTNTTTTATGSTTDSEDSSVSIILPSFVLLITLFIVS